MTTETDQQGGAPAGAPLSTPESLAEVQRVAKGISDAMSRVIEGKPEVVRTAVTVLLAEGHLLLEDVPGVGKTMLAKALARSIDCSVRRIQFTPDLLPSDITGVSIFNQDVRDFEFRPGAVFANVVVGDEINRASPKTQSALLESMEEHQVTVDGRRTPSPGPSSSWRRRTRWRWRAPTRCPRPSATASWRASRWGTRRPPPRSPCSTCTAGRRRSTSSDRRPTPRRWPG